MSEDWRERCLTLQMQLFNELKVNQLSADNYVLLRQRANALIQTEKKKTPIKKALIKAVRKFILRKNFASMQSDLNPSFNIYLGIKR